MNNQSNNKASETTGEQAGVVSTFWPVIDPKTVTFSGLAEPQVYPPGTTLLRKGEMASTVSVIRTGIVRLSVTEPGRPPTIVGLRSRDWWIGCALVLSGAASLYDIVTLSECSIATVDAEAFRLELLKEPRLLAYFLALQSQELLATQHYSMMQACDSMGSSRAGLGRG